MFVWRPCGVCDDELTKATESEYSAVNCSNRWASFRGPRRWSRTLCWNTNIMMCSKLLKDDVSRWVGRGVASRDLLFTLLPFNDQQKHTNSHLLFTRSISRSHFKSKLSQRIYRSYSLPFIQFTATRFFELVSLFSYNIPWQMLIYAVKSFLSHFRLWKVFLETILLWV